MNEISVRQWQEKFRDGAFDDKSIATQCEAGWYDWFCNDGALAGRLKKMAKLVMAVTDPFILDNYYVWFKNNCPAVGPLYDDVRFEPLAGERDSKYFLVSLDSPHSNRKWSLITERYGFEAPEFECADIRDMVKYINGMAHELEQGVQPAFIAEKCAVEKYIARHEGLTDVAVHREQEHCYSYCRNPRDLFTKSVVVAIENEEQSPGCDLKHAEKIDGIYVFGERGTDFSKSRVIPAQATHRKPSRQKRQDR